MEIDKMMIDGVEKRIEAGVNTALDMVGVVSENGK
tara:strand:- start:142 stop:246 length:105 start_codon:yes stop_codon:yes gene_type:complete